MYLVTIPEFFFILLLYGYFYPFIRLNQTIVEKISLNSSYFSLVIIFTKFLCSRFKQLIFIFKPFPFIHRRKRRNSYHMSVSARFPLNLQVSARFALNFSASARFALNFPNFFSNRPISSKLRQITHGKKLNTIYKIQGNPT